MINKYKTITLFEIENGWIIRIEYPDKPQEPTQESHISKHCPNKESLIKELNELI